MIVVPAGTNFVHQWLSLVRDVEPLFGPMPHFERTLRRNIERGTAYCVLDEEAFAGGMLLGEVAPDYSISWLAVLASQRRRGAGDALMRAVLEHFPPPCTITVDTFREEEPEGRAARRLYEKYGFVPGALFEHEGMARQTYALYRP